MSRQGFFLLLLSLYRFFVYILWPPDLCFNGFCVYDCVCPILFCLFYVLFNFYYYLDVCCFLTRDRRGVDSDEREGGEDIRGVGREETILEYLV